MPFTFSSGAVKVTAPTSGTVSVTLTAASGATPTVYSDPATTTPVSLPLSLAASASQKVYLASPGTYTLSVKLNGVEGANYITGTTVTFDVIHGETAFYDYSSLNYGTPSVWNAGSGGSSSSPVETVNTVATSGAAQTIPDVTTATISRITLTANCTLTFPTAAAGKSFHLALVQDGTGSRTVTWPATAKWQGANAPVLSTGAGKVDTVAFTCVDGTNWYGYLSGLDIR